MILKILPVIILGDIIGNGDIYSLDILLDEKSYETFENILVTFHTKLQLVQNHWVLLSIK